MRSKNIGVCHLRIYRMVTGSAGEQPGRVTVEMGNISQLKAGLNGLAFPFLSNC